MTVLNGLGAEEAVRRAGDWPIISGVTFMSGTRHSDTHIEYVLDTETWIGPYEYTPFSRGAGRGGADDARRPEGRGAAGPAAGAVVEADLQRHRQRRRRADRPPPRRALRRRGASRPISATSCTRSSTRARPSPPRPGIELHDDPWEMNVLATQRGSAHYPSMLEDVEAHRRTEIDLITGRARARGGAPRRRRPAPHRALPPRQGEGGVLCVTPPVRSCPFTYEGESREGSQERGARRASSPWWRSSPPPSPASRRRRQPASRS